MKNKNPNREAEIKLKLTESVYLYLKNTCTAYKEVSQKNHFLDTSDYTLLHHRWVLRIRIEDSWRGYITVKGPGEINNALHIRPEFESPVLVDQAESLLQGFDLSSIHLSPCTELVKRFGNQHVLPFLFFHNQRIIFSWNEWKFELDKTTIEKNLFYELEVETDPAQRDTLEKELKRLFQNQHWDYVPSSKSKFKRALDLKKV